MALQKEELWKIYTSKNPCWLTDGANLTPEGLKKLFEQTFDRGHELGLLNGKALEKKDRSSTKSQSGPKGFFEEMFG